MRRAQPTLRATRSPRRDRPVGVADRVPVGASAVALEPWPLITGQERLRILIEAIDGTGPRSPWEAAAELRALRRALRRVSEAEAAVRDWR